MGVVSAVELRSRSLVTGEKCSGGGVSRGSSFTKGWRYEVCSDGSSNERALWKARAFSRGRV